MNLPSQLNFISKNYRPKCDLCNGICDIEWFLQKQKDVESINGHGNVNGINGIDKENAPGHGFKPILICNRCYEANNYPKNMRKEDFEFSNFFNIVNNGKFIT